MKRNWIILAVVIALAGTAVYHQIDRLSHRASAPAGEAPRIGRLAPSFALTGIDGAVYQVGGEREKPLLLNFWASWCIPCQVELPDLKELYDAFGDRFDIYGVNITSLDTQKDATKTVKEYGLTFPILFDDDGTVAESYQFNSIPTSFLIRRDGTIVDVFSFAHREELEHKITDLLENQ